MLCTAPRDKVFGIQALVEKSSRIEIDYRKPLEQLNMEVTRALLDSELRRIAIANHGRCCLGYPADCHCSLNTAITVNNGELKQVVARACKITSALLRPGKDPKTQASQNLVVLEDSKFGLIICWEQMWHLVRRAERSVDGHRLPARMSQVEDLSPFKPNIATYVHSSEQFAMGKPMYTRRNRSRNVVLVEEDILDFRLALMDDKYASFSR
jgi:hypothetical protein